MPEPAPAESHPQVQAASNTKKPAASAVTPKAKMIEWSGPAVMQAFIKSNQESNIIQGRWPGDERPTPGIHPETRAVNCVHVPNISWVVAMPPAAANRGWQDSRCNPIMREGMLFADERFGGSGSVAMIRFATSTPPSDRQERSRRHSQRFGDRANPKSRPFPLR